MKIEFQKDLWCINQKLQQEIEERKQVEVALVQSEQLFAKTFQDSPIPMCVFDANSRKFLDVNNSFVKVFAYQPTEVINRTAADIMLCAELDNYLVQVVQEKVVPHNLEVILYTKTGSTRRGLLSLERIQLIGEICVLCTINDITERIQMEKEMARLDRLNLVGEMAASIGHEVRNPLTTVRGFLQLFQKKELYASQKEYLSIMIEELDRANLIITEFLSLAKNKRIKLVPHSLNAIISKLYPLLQADALAFGKDVLLELGDIPSILLDENEIRQCILNIVRNGLEAIPAKGKVLIRTYFDSKFIVLAIQDNGHGIPPEVMGSFGTPFLTTKDTGTGLGIPICYRIAERHHAKIEIETGATGTTFLIKFHNTNLQDNKQNKVPESIVANKLS